MTTNTNANHIQLCANCRLRDLTAHLRSTLDNHQPLCQPCYNRLHQLTAHWKRHRVISLSRVREARTQVHRLNLMKVRYEDLVEASEGAEVRLSMDELQELGRLMWVFDSKNLERRELVEREVRARVEEEECRQNREREEKRRGVVGGVSELLRGAKGK